MTDKKKNQKWPYVSLSEGNCLWSFISERLLKIATAGEHRPDWVTNNISRHKSMVCNHHIPNRKGNWSLDALIQSDSRSNRAPPTRFSGLTCCSVARNHPLPFCRPSNCQVSLTAVIISFVRFFLRLIYGRPSSANTQEL